MLEELLALGHTGAEYDANPTSGFFVIIPKKDAIELKMSVEEAFKLVISAGVVTPETLKIKENK